MLIVAAFSRHADALAWAGAQLVDHFGPLASLSPAFPFDQTSYYEPTMGSGLRKQLLAFRDLIGAEDLPRIKLQTNMLEADLAATGKFPEVRPINLDPGALSLGKFMLATTKDQAHRIYLGKGIFAEVTLRFQAGAFHPWPWTYADYKEPPILNFLREAREIYRGLLAAAYGEKP
jgi:hypothetical protein